MIKALNIATSGLLQAEKRATDVARDILKTTAIASSFSVNDAGNQAVATTDQGQNIGGSVLAGRSAVVPNGGDFSGLVQQFADLRAETAGFKASAAAFKAIDETLDKALGTLLDDKG